MLLYRQIQAGNLDVKDLFDTTAYNRLVHVDNRELVPDGTPVKLFYEHISTRPQEDLTQKYKDWIEENKEKVFYVTREGASSSMVCLSKNTLKNSKEETIPWLFDIYSDLLYLDEAVDEWVHLAELEVRLADRAAETKIETNDN